MRCCENCFNTKIKHWNFFNFLFNMISITLLASFNYAWLYESSHSVYRWWPNGSITLIVYFNYARVLTVFTSEDPMEELHLLCLATMHESSHSVYHWGSNMIISLLYNVMSVSRVLKILKYRVHIIYLERRNRKITFERTSRTNVESSLFDVVDKSDFLSTPHCAFTRGSFSDFR